MTALFKKVDLQKKDRKLILLIALLCIIGAYIFYIYPRQIVITYNAIEYQAGSNQLEKPIKISIDGFYYNKILSNDTFNGTITIDGENLKVNELVVDTSGGFLDGINSIGNYFSYGRIYASRGMDTITICIFRNGGWSSEDGFILSAPSMDRANALNISNNLMRDYLVNKIQ